MERSTAPGGHQHGAAPRGAYQPPSLLAGSASSGVSDQPCPSSPEDSSHPQPLPPPPLPRSTWPSSSYTSSYQVSSSRKVSSRPSMPARFASTGGSSASSTTVRNRSWGYIGGSSCSAWWSRTVCGVNAGTVFTSMTTISPVSTCMKASMRATPDSPSTSATSSQRCRAPFSASGVTMLAGGGVRFVPTPLSNFSSSVSTSPRSQTTTEGVSACMAPSSPMMPTVTSTHRLLPAHSTSSAPEALLRMVMGSVSTKGSTISCPVPERGISMSQLCPDRLPALSTGSLARKASA
mmetsp:Transcript_18433/g.46686  ORF Transcript_18433/g.46686 Transcript_18433/m.46686 type:complete len:292 (+) Transcript_18433:159-1034(+)